MPQTKTQLEEALYATLNYFDLSEYPLTLLETHQWLWQNKASIPEVFAGLEQHPEIENTFGMYHLKGRSKIVHTRLRRHVITEKKLRKRQRYLRFLASLPYVEAILITNSVAIHNAHEDSDLDIAILTSSGKLWSTRFFATLPAKLLKLRPKISQHHVEKKDKICLCFYTTPEHFNLTNERITSPDINFIYWVATMLPIHNQNQQYETFIDANQWITDYLPNFEPIITVSSRLLKALRLPFIHSLTKLLSHEPSLRKIQQWILPGILKKLADAPDTRVVINDTLIKLHAHDQRLAIQQIWQKKIEDYQKRTIMRQSGMQKYMRLWVTKSDHAPAKAHPV
ncbi:MAG: hypothetical protein A3B74_04260 [Candidatus Kerfeldbacteria bacterium RIFCSPHIGHO2_02_FULL_42_14]|uniref:Uncharacterized protein n=1 Tax=Candidatus Kerfeldbacteria bacterium RIFCSPHIGHO2_02_FULL_42_14 TaxID=1798540 RepID=A0A1G2ANR0_9BACT|nr:MAG: hypothetical protein A3B74_04260 [Candidatus Kerfeldbacteria bacterium RIFCSPHIGHO2_02_FULL_42_14]OGY83394.1 MAG: hypothetical protein A3I91_01950 [Candidatus Kerfeldbacteria bacterium RIFCSPLOWO2_02_FULL_42_19]OGY85483.1 MAG: hypothetical protein A3G01_03555 [Candidatus Kerfeldbacteria bacterium RIFCSPLOWO2_12_FULL_43_9]